MPGLLRISIRDSGGPPPSGVESSETHNGFRAMWRRGSTYANNGRPRRTRNRVPTGKLAREPPVADWQFLTVLKPSVEWP